MKALKQRSSQDGVEHHCKNPVRVYAQDAIQRPRIEKARAYLKAATEALHGYLTIVELGCGTGDISGVCSNVHEVIGVDCNEACLTEALKRFPEMSLSNQAIESKFHFPCDVVVLCEILEHLTDPQSIVEAWLPQARASVISHPIDEQENYQCSGGDHCWSLSEQDFKNWFALGGHDLVRYEIFEMGNYRIALGYGLRR